VKNKEQLVRIVYEKREEKKKKEVPQKNGRENLVN